MINLFSTLNKQETLEDHHLRKNSFMDWHIYLLFSFLMSFTNILSASTSISRREIYSFSGGNARHMLAEFGLAAIYYVFAATLWVIYRVEDGILDPPLCMP